MELKIQRRDSLQLARVNSPVAEIKAEARARLALSPQLRRSLALLRMSAAELRAELSCEVEKNPLLEADDFDALAESSESSADSNAVFRVPAKGGLRAHLHLQCRAATLPPTVKKAADALIEMIDDDGYLDSDADDDTTLFQEALKAVQAFEPPGVGARNLRENLLLQLDDMKIRRAENPDILESARVIVDKRFGDLSRRRIDRLPKRNLEESLALIGRLSPRPGGNFSDDEAPWAIADIVVVKRRGLWSAEPGPGLNFQIRFSPDASQLADGGGAFLRLQRDARGFARALSYRRRTVLSVAQLAVDYQSEFFEQGEIALRPLPMRKIAAELNVSRATVTTAIADKWLSCPRGFFALKLLCARPAPSDSKKAAGAVREVMRKVIAAEDKSRPLSDSVLVRRLAAEGILLSRRTAAKYRARAGLAPSHLRRQLKGAINR